MTESQAEVWGDDTDSDGHAVPVTKLGQTTSSADGPQSWMTSSSGEVERQGCPGHL